MQKQICISFVLFFFLLIFGFYFFALLNEINLNVCASSEIKLHKIPAKRLGPAKGNSWLNIMSYA